MARRTLTNARIFHFFEQLGTLTGGEFVSDEDAVEPDLPLTDEEVSAVFFHADKIAEYLAAHAEQ